MFCYATEDYARLSPECTGSTWSSLVSADAVTITVRCYHISMHCVYSEPTKLITAGSLSRFPKTIAKSDHLLRVLGSGADCPNILGVSSSKRIPPQSAWFLHVTLKDHLSVLEQMTIANFSSTCFLSSTFWFRRVFSASRCTDTDVH